MVYSLASCVGLKSVIFLEIDVKLDLTLVGRCQGNSEGFAMIYSSFVGNFT